MMEVDRQVANIVITGFSGTGKSLVGRRVAERLNWGFVDTDTEIVERAKKPIAKIFAQEGEGKFRELERRAIKKASGQRETVIAIGGGAIVDRRNHELLAKTAMIVCLEAKPETIYERLFREAACSPGTEVRPLLSVEDPLERIRELKSSRQSHYAKADWTIHTDTLAVDEVAAEVVRAWRLLHRGRPNLMPMPSRGRKSTSRAKGDNDVTCVVGTAIQSYPVFVGYGFLDKLGDKMRETALSGTAIIISDENVFPLYGSRVVSILKTAGFGVNHFVVPSSEEVKSMDYAVRAYDFLVGHRVERDDSIVALGGGMVGDLAGFVAATFLRGMPWIQVPTSLVAMVDASIGGKVGVNHPEGKNLIGAFYQPSLVVIDPQTLTTLPQRELTSGWAEVIKHGLILDRELFEFLETNVNRVKKLDPQLLTRAIGRSAAIKAWVVSQDERERTGKRIMLNYGHTIGHGLEAATEYRRFLHGEAVAVGMMGAAKLSQRMGLLSPATVERQKVLLEEFGLPTSLQTEGGRRRRSSRRGSTRLSIGAVTRAMEVDKKMSGKAIRWVLLQDIGEAVARSDVPQRDVLAVLRELL
jgi:shikimate kinase/3-dehydroquinate synthase